MQIKLNKIKPAVEVGFFDKDSDIWDNDVLFEDNNYYLVNSPSGRGKSSLIAFIYGTRKDYYGDVQIDGIDNRIFDFKKWSNIRQKQISVLFQDLRLFKNLTGIENILVNSQQTNFVSKAEIIEMTDKLNVTKLLNKKCQHMSFGEQQRVAIIRSLAQEFDFLLLDEPFSHLDKANIEIACQLIDASCKKNNAGLVLTTLGKHYNLEYHQVLSV